MKKFLIIILGCPLFFVGCFSDDEEGGTTTIFEGVVIYEDDMSPVNEATLIFQGRKRVSGFGQLDEVIFEREISLGNDGSFRFELEKTRSSIDYFAVNLFIGDNAISIDCAPNSCASLTPRKTFTEMRFVARRE